MTDKTAEQVRTWLPIGLTVLGMVATMAVQTIGVVWYMAHQDSVVASHSVALARLERQTETHGLTVTSITAQLARIDATLTALLAEYRARGARP